ncbi:phage holin family protein [Planosporangium flavigriseum]|uniref:Membrane protein n=1 Tax=Planosporangium flavigriseum TaxID=373681 RepID=A0A8J3LHC3_9ACTN|nr:phage holin family protein [Planosporangium flavigriseum]NJC65302.1 phage holin family protein [Planosporangium flavigriseum]GIG73343.1 membrane protein [Planosporangium flavigriseum]
MTNLMNQERTAERVDGRSTAELVKLASEQVTHLVRDELRLAQLELSRKGKQAGVGAGMLGAAGIVAFYGGAGLLATVVLLLALVMPAWLATLIVGVVLMAIAGVMAMLGRAQVKKATPPVPRRTVDSLKEDIETVSEAVKERGVR